MGSVQAADRDDAVKTKLGCLIYLEVAICFGGSFINLPFGLLFLPQWIGDVIDGEADSLPSILYWLGGVLGTIGIVATLRMIIGGWQPSMRVRRAIQIFVVAGLTAIVAYAINTGLFSSETWEDGIRVGLVIPLVFAFLLPVICSAHLIFLARDQLLRFQNPGQRATAEPRRSTPMEIRWKTLARDTAIVWVAQNFGDFVTAFMGALPVGRNAIANPLVQMALGFSDFVFGVAGFTIVGALTRTKRFEHLLLVGLCVWLIAAPTVLYAPVTLLQWFVGGGLFQIVVVLVGEGLSYLFTRPSTVQSGGVSQAVAADGDG